MDNTKKPRVKKPRIQKRYGYYVPVSEYSTYENVGEVKESVDCYILDRTDESTKKPQSFTWTRPTDSSFDPNIAFGPMTKLQLKIFWRFVNRFLPAFKTTLTLSSNIKSKSIERFYVYLGTPEYEFDYQAQEAYISLVRFFKHKKQGYKQLAKQKAKAALIQAQSAEVNVDSLSA